ncbi:hypothetical protein EBZ80_05450 [bacterium]|nr:hypothetical protein [bacterium]
MADDRFVDSLLDPEFIRHVRMLRILREKHPRLYQIVYEKGSDLLDTIQQLDADGSMVLRAQARPQDRKAVLQRAQRRLLRGDQEALAAFTALGDADKESVAAELGARTGFSRMKPKDVSDILSGRSTALRLYESQHQRLRQHIRSFTAKRRKTVQKTDQKKSIQDVLSEQSIGGHLYGILGRGESLRRTSVPNLRRYDAFTRSRVRFLDMNTLGKSLNRRDMIRLLFPQYTGLKTLVVSRDLLAEDVADLLPRACGALRNLEELIGGTIDKPENARGFARLLGCFPRLKKLSIRIDIGSDEIVRGMMGLRNLRELRMTIRGRTDDAMLRVISGMTALEVLEFEGNAEILGILHNLVNLRELDLSNCSLQYNMDTIVEKLGSLEKLKKLVLQSNNLRSQDLLDLKPGIRALLSREPACLEELDLSDNMINSNGVIEFLDGFPEITRLKRLDLSRNWIGSTSEGAQALARLAQQQQHMEIDYYWLSQSEGDY